MPITEQLLRILPNAGSQASLFVPVLNTAMDRYGIVGTPRASRARPSKPCAIRN